MQLPYIVVERIGDSILVGGRRGCQVCGKGQGTMRCQVMLSFGFNCTYM